MTVERFIELLQAMPPTAVVVYTTDNDRYPELMEAQVSLQDGLVVLGGDV